MLKGIPAFPVRCKVRLSPMTRKPARLKTFMPNRMSLVSTAPPNLADIDSGMRPSSDAYLSLPSLSYAPATRPPWRSRGLRLKINRNQVIRKVPTIPLSSSAPRKICWPVWRCSPLRRRQRDQARILDPSLPAASNFAPSWLKGSFKRRSGQRSVPCLSSPGSTVPRQGRWPSPPPW